MKCGIAKKNGSALVNDSMTKVTCNVYACRSVERTKRGYAEKGTFSVTARFAPFSNVKSTKVQEDEKLLSSRLKLSLESALQLEKFPKSVLEAHVVILDSHLSSTFADIQSASTICLSLAIANAGIDMNDLVVGTRLQLVTKKPSFLCLAIMPNLQKITYISHQGETKPEVLSSVCSSFFLSLSLLYNQCPIHTTHTHTHTGNIEVP